MGGPPSLGGLVHYKVTEEGFEGVLSEIMTDKATIDAINGLLAQA